MSHWYTLQQRTPPVGKPIMVRWADDINGLFGHVVVEEDAESLWFVDNYGDIYEPHDIALWTEAPPDPLEEGRDGS
jgi:hypothetical protein